MTATEIQVKTLLLRFLPRPLMDELLSIIRLRNKEVQTLLGNKNIEIKLLKDEMEKLSFTLCQNGIEYDECKNKGFAIYGGYCEECGSIEYDRAMENLVEIM